MVASAPDIYAHLSLAGRAVKMEQEKESLKRVRFLDANPRIQPARVPVALLVRVTTDRPSTARQVYRANYVPAVGRDVQPEGEALASADGPRRVEREASEA
jgi:hypothetical protein